MEQKTIWMKYLITGISLLILLSIGGCGKERIERIKTVNYVYINKTGTNLVMEIYNNSKEKFKSFSIADGGQVETNTTMDQVPGVFYFDSFESRIGDSIVIRFSNGQCLFYSKSKEDEIFRIEKYDNFSKELLQESKFTLYYTIDANDFAMAVDCE